MRPVADTAWHEFAHVQPLAIPPHARAIFASHLAYRRDQQATDTDPYFIHPGHPKLRSPDGALRAAIKRTCSTLGLDPPWLHDRGCVNGADVGLNRRTAAWSTERGLSVTVLQHALAQLPTPRRPGDHVPRWTGRTFPNQRTTNPP